MPTTQEINSPINGITIDSVLSPLARRALRSLDVEEALFALEEMFQDAFLLGRHCCTLDYNKYSLDDRADILHLYTSLKTLLPVLSRYSGEFSPYAEMGDDDYRSLEFFAEGVVPAQQLIDILEEMMITSVFWKFRVENNKPSQSYNVEGIHNTYAVIRDLLKGYIPKLKRPLILNRVLQEA